MMKHLRKINLLLWKNYLIQKRTPVRTLTEVFMPLLLCAVLVSLRFIVLREEVKQPVVYDPFAVSDHCILHPLLQRNPWIVGYSPNNSKFVDFIMTNLIPREFNMGELMYQTESFPDELSMQRRVMESGKNKNITLAGIVFDGTDLTSEYPRNIKIKIRFPGISRVPDLNSTTLDTQAPNWRTHMIFPLYEPFGPRDAHSQTGGQPGYCEEGFLFLQNRVYEEAARYFVNISADKLPYVEFQRFPYPPYSKDQYLPALILFISCFIIIVYTYSSVSTIKMVAIEKETQMKGAMEIMGLPNWMHWTAWTMKEFIQWLLPSIFVTILLTMEWANKGCVLKYTNPLVLLTILADFSLSSIMFCFLISVCFNRANSAATVGSALWFVSYAPYMVMQPHYTSMSLWEIRAWSLLSNTNIGYIFQFLVNFEGSGTGMQWSNLFQLHSPADKISAGELLVTLLFDAFLYFCLAIYIETAFPGHYGIPKAWYFPFQITYWCGYDHRHRDNNISKKGIEITNLCKVYSNGKKAVDNLCMKMHEDQITVLLGHNGAGKSTTMSILSGLVKPTSGTAYINGFDVWSEMSQIRDRLGLCPQYNLLFPELTIKEHLIFFGMLKGRSGRDLDEEINKYVKMLEMESRVNYLAGHLSGGYQRKLSVAIALIGKSKIVLMDEPTAGMDPNARRRLWDLLQLEREGRTMLMTTHLLDEADLLGDRVAILSRGQLKCIGTPFNLKTDPEGYRYTLNLVKNMTPGARVDIDSVTAFLKVYCDTIRLQTDSRTELRFKLKDSHMMPLLMVALEEQKSKYGIQDFGVSLTSLEDVYLRITNESWDEMSTAKSINDEGNGTPVKSLNSLSSEKNEFYYSVSEKNPSNFVLWKKQFKAMLEKKMLISRRSWILHSVQVLITVIFIFIANIVTNSWRGSSDLSPLEFSLMSYRNPIMIMRNTSEAYNEQLDTFVRKLTAVVESQGGSMKFIQTNGTMNDIILNEYQVEGLSTVNERYMAAIEVGDTLEGIKMYFNNQPFHIVPTAFNILQNITLSMVTHANMSLSFINAPFPYLPEEKLLKFVGGSNLGFQVGFNTGFAQSFVSAIFLLSLLKEKVIGAQHLQYVSGVLPSAYWSASVLWDFTVYLMVLVAEMLVLYLYRDAAFSDPEQLVQLCVLLLFYNWSVIPIISLSSFVFSTPSLGFLVVSIMGLLTGCSTFLMNLVLEIRPLRMVQEAESLENVVIWFPHYALCNGLRNIYINYDALPGHSQNFDRKYAWDKPGIGRNLFIFFVTGLFFNIALLSLEYLRHNVRKLLSIVKKCWLHLSINPGAAEEELQQVTTVSSLYEDVDIRQEKCVVEKSAKVDYCVIIKNVSKCYAKKMAVKSINLALSAHECFVLLGTNGAGKTTTFKMLTTYEKVTCGSISICSMDIVRERKRVLQLIGYCPQHDGLIDKLTGRETLRMFCTLRGIDQHEHDLVISQLSIRLQFRRMLDVSVADYSGGMKRKLSAAVAMIGDPPVLLFDEPTAGMDPDARAHLWKVLQEERARGKCVIITTHSLEECEALCSRLAVMVEGEIRCIGSAQYLKNKFASGHTLHVKFPTKLMENVKLHVSTHLSGSSILEEFKGVIMFQIPPGTSCSKIFFVMEKAKTESMIEDYSIQQTSLEQVFSEITKRYCDDSVCNEISFS